MDACPSLIGRRDDFQYPGTDKREKKKKREARWFEGSRVRGLP